MEYLFERCDTSEEVRDTLLSKGPGYLLYKIVDDCFDYCFPMLRKMGNKLERIEEDLFLGRSEDSVRDISNAKQEIINFRKIIRPQRPVLRDLERNKQRYLAEDMEVYFDDIVDASERIWDMLENYKEVVEALDDTNESLISHRVNDVLRVLTAFSVVILPLTLIASIFGMNVGRPRRGRHHRVLADHRRDGRDTRQHARPTSANAAGCSPLLGPPKRLCDLQPEAHRVVGPAVLGIDLGRVREQKPGHARIHRRYPLAVAQRHDRLGVRLPEGPLRSHPRAFVGRDSSASARARTRRGARPRRGRGEGRRAARSSPRKEPPAPVD